MEILNLATKEKQDEILAKPIGTDWFDSTFQTLDISTPIHNPSLIIEVDGKGIVTYIKNGLNNTNYVIEVDGTTQGLSISAGVLAPIFISFSTHLKITADKLSGIDLGYNLF